MPDSGHFFPLQKKREEPASVRPAQTHRFRIAVLMLQPPHFDLNLSAFRPRGSSFLRFCTTCRRCSIQGALVVREHSVFALFIFLLGRLNADRCFPDHSAPIIRPVSYPRRLCTDRVCLLIALLLDSFLAGHGQRPRPSVRRNGSGVCRSLPEAGRICDTTYVDLYRAVSYCYSACLSSICPLFSAFRSHYSGKHFYRPTDTKPAFAINTFLPNLG